MKPIIGIVASVLVQEDVSRLYISEYYRNAVIEFGGEPLLLLPTQQILHNKVRISENAPMTDAEKESLLKWVKQCDGIIIPGGTKMFEYYFVVLDYAIKEDVPIIGTCLGMQVMANYNKKIETVRNSEDKISHNVDEDYVHSIKIDKNSKIYDIVKQDTFMVNSLHNYHVVDSGIYKAVGYSADGLIEALEYPNNTFNIGVQWHPEMMVKYDDISRKIWTSFMSCAYDYKEKANK